MVPRVDSSACRPCGDLRRLNASTLPDCYTIPHIHDIAVGLQGMHIFTSLDFFKEYYQIPCRSKWYHQVCYHHHFWFLRIHQNAVWFMKSSSVFSKFDRQSVKRFLFHIRIYRRRNNSKQYENENLDHLQLVFARLQNSELKIYVDKCTF